MLPLCPHSSSSSSFSSSSSSSFFMASFSRFLVVTLFLVTVLGGSQLASCQSYDGGRVAQNLPSFSSAARKLRDHPAFIGKNEVLEYKSWCVPRDGVADAQLQANVDFGCSNGADCDPIQPGRPCFEPNTPRFHATYAMNSYFQGHGKNLDACSFGGTGLIIILKDPSTEKCKYPGYVGDDSLGLMLNKEETRKLQ